MSKPSFDDGICLNSEHNGLLSLEEKRLEKLIKKEPISNVYHVEHTPFARGKFATVRKCSCPTSGDEFAAKFIRKRRRLADQRQDIVHEMAVLSVASGCSRIVGLRDVFETPAEMALILEMASGGELQRVLDHEEGLEEPQAARIMRQILEGLSFLHERNIAHLDLKPQNLLMTGTYPDCDIKLCDFGISRVICNGVEVREILGTPDYVAPEILNYEPISLSTDIWSVGVLAYVLLTGYSPFGGDTKQETFCNIAQSKLSFPDELFEGISSSARDFICATLVKNPRKRLSSEDCLQHPWICGAFVTPCRSDTMLVLGNHKIINNDHSYHNGAGECNGKMENGIISLECCEYNEELECNKGKRQIELNDASSGCYEEEKVNGETESKGTEENESPISNGCMESEEYKRQIETGVTTGRIHENDMLEETLIRNRIEESKFSECSLNGRSDEWKEIVEICDSSGVDEVYEFCGIEEFKRPSYSEVSDEIVIHNNAQDSDIYSQNTFNGVVIGEEDDLHCRLENRLCSESNSDKSSHQSLVCEIGNGEMLCTKSVPELTTEDDVFLRVDKEHNGEVRPSEVMGIDEEGLPVKRSKNCCRRSSYPVSSCVSCAQCKEQCCHLHPTPSADVLARIARQHRISNISNSPVEIVLDRGIIC